MDFGKALGDDMIDADFAALDGMGMGGEMQQDNEEAEMAFNEGGMAIDDAMMDGMMEQDMGETQEQTEDVVEEFGIDSGKGLYE